MGITRIEITDDGHGIAYAYAENVFGTLGGSAKKTKKISPGGRKLHGEEEVDESSGTWGYYHFEIDDVEKAKNKLEQEVIDLLEEAVAEIDL